MDVFSIARACFRRWYVLVPLLIVTAVLALVQGRSVKPEYTATSSVIVVAPNLTAQNTKSDNPLPVNPLGDVTTVQLALVGRLNSVQTAEQVARAAGTGGGFSATPDNKGPIIELTAAGSSRAAAEATLSAAANATPSVLRTLQSDLKVPSSTYFRVAALTESQGAFADYPHRARNIVLVALAGVLVSIILAQLVDFLLLARASRRQRRRSNDDRPLPGASSFDGQGRTPASVGASDRQTYGL